MIQRIQSVYLFLTTVLSLLFLKGGILSFINEAGESIKLVYGGILKTAGNNATELIDNSLVLQVLIIIIPVLALVTIFLFKKRTIQILLSGILIALISFFIIVCGFYGYQIITKYNGELVPGVKMVLPLIMLILAILAFRGIKKDDQLVKSYDRLR
jgi:hypothetical protein